MKMVLRLEKYLRNRINRERNIGTLPGFESFLLNRYLLVTFSTYQYSPTRTYSPMDLTSSSGFVM